MLRRILSSGLVAGLITASAVISHAAECPQTQTAGGGFSLAQRQFADGAQDLAIVDEAGIAHRITFGGGPGALCRYAALAIARGGDWGWHVAWADSQGVWYARMDGAAWVSSPPKRLAHGSAEALRFEQVAMALTLTWTNAPGGKRFRAQSDDEGRNWTPAEQIPARD